MGKGGKPKGAEALKQLRKTQNENRQAKMAQEDASPSGGGFFDGWDIGGGWDR